MIKFKWVFKSQVFHKNANEGIYALLQRAWWISSRLRLGCLLCKQPKLTAAQGHRRVMYSLPTLCDTNQNVNRENVDISQKTFKMSMGDWRDGWVVQIEYCSCRTQILVPELRSSFRGIWHAWPQKVCTLTCINLSTDTVRALTWRFTELIYRDPVTKSPR